MLNFGNEFDARSRHRRSIEVLASACIERCEVRAVTHIEAHRRGAHEGRAFIDSRRMFCIASRVDERLRSMIATRHASMRSRLATQHRADLRNGARVLCIA
ncbi:hypothetical protein BURK_003235 [Burkholderia sp. SJ98]|nr:hypothetical protein BURK_003235 [Burkholderia sp. SJ98]